MDSFLRRSMLRRALPGRRRGMFRGGSDVIVTLEEEIANELDFMGGLMLEYVETPYRLRGELQHRIMMIAEYLWELWGRYWNVPTNDPQAEQVFYSRLFANVPDVVDPRSIRVAEVLPDTVYFISGWDG